MAEWLLILVMANDYGYAMTRAVVQTRAQCNFMGSQWVEQNTTKLVVTGARYHCIKSK